MSDSLAVLDEEIRDLKLHIGANVEFPPNCFLAMKAEFIEYESRQSLTVAFPILKESLNPLRTMQGGFLAAAFDNAFGPLSYLAARCPCVTLNLNTQFIRSLGLDERLTVRAKVVSRSKEVLQMTGEAFNSRNKLVALATATATMLQSNRRTPS